MATSRRIRRGSTAQHATFTGAAGEITLDTTKQVFVAHDGATAGGFPMQREVTAGRNIVKTGNTLEALARAADYLSVTSARNLAATDAGCTLEDDGTNRTLTAVTGLGKGFFCRLLRSGAGNLTLAKGSGVTFAPTNPANFATASQWTMLYVECVADTGSAATFLVSVVAP